MCCFQRCTPNIISSVDLVLCQVYPLLRQVGFLPGCVTFKSLMCGDILNAFRLLFLSASALAVGLCWGVTVHSAVLRTCMRQHKSDEACLYTRNINTQILDSCRCASQTGVRIVLLLNILCKLVLN